MLAEKSFELIEDKNLQSTIKIAGKQTALENDYENQISLWKDFLMIENLISYLRDFRNYYFPKKNPFGKDVQASKNYYLSIFEKQKMKYI